MAKKLAAKAGSNLVPRRSTALAKFDYGNLPSTAGMEGADRESFAIPFLQVLQKMSPQLDRNQATYVKGAKEGDIFNTANGETYDGSEGVLVMPVTFKRTFTAWTIREKGGGFKGEYPPSDPIVMGTTRDDKNRSMLPDRSTQLVDTRLHAIILLNGDHSEPALLTSTPTQIKKSKRWMTVMQERQRQDNLPTFAHVYKLTTIPEKNDRGSWMGWQIDYVGPCEDQEQIDAAVGFFGAMKIGTAQMKVDTSMGAGD